jgi:hypothetical protein
VTRPRGVLMDSTQIGPVARDIQAANPPWRLGIDLQSFSWFAMRDYSPSCTRFVYASDLMSLALRLRRLRGENFLP